MRAFLQENIGHAVLLMTDGRGARGIIHDLDDTTVTLWNPKMPFQIIPLDWIVGWSAQHRLERWLPEYERCTKSMTCALHYP